MADGKPAYIEANVYTVSKQMNRMMMNPEFAPLVFKDQAGNVVLTSGVKGIGRHAVLVDVEGKEIGYVEKKGISLGNKAHYLFFGDQKNQIGQVVIKSGLMGMSESIVMEDPNGSQVGMATGNFMGFSFQIYDASGNNVLAVISKDLQGQQQQQSGGLMGLIGMAENAAIGTMLGSYRIEIKDSTINDMSRLFILELVVVLDELYHPAQQGIGGGPGMGPMI